MNHNQTFNHNELHKLNKQGFFVQGRDTFKGIIKRNIRTIDKNRRKKERQKVNQ